MGKSVYEVVIGYRDFKEGIDEDEVTYAVEAPSTAAAEEQALDRHAEDVPGDELWVVSCIRTGDARDEG